jgi:hypothetical protein
MENRWVYVEPRGRWQRKEPDMSEHEEQGQKIGAGHLKAMVRAGAKELAQVLPAFPEGVRPVEEPGLAGNLTPSEIVETKGPGQSHNEHLQGFTGRVSQEREHDQGHER